MDKRDCELERGRSGVKKAKNTKFFCGDCYIVFEILSDFDRRKFKYVNCPGCGDHVAVEPYDEPGKSENRFWTDEEVELLDKFIAKEIHIYQLKIMTGRNEMSIYMKMNKRLQGKGLPKRKIIKPWTNEHIGILDKVIAEEITIKEAAEMMDRNYRSVENKKYERIRELGLIDAGRRYNAWKIEDLRLADQCIAGEMTVRELAEKLDKNLKTVRNFIGKRKKQKQGVKS